ncbi:hypothetical protein PR202_gb11498 [Eleusine coracana subsp. coracana]|uniref:Bifunctional inhibitor/plant lipid transfer protein/seed storage helical domain-containing protein n=1 Tax=Eleusine coracana subsp. coracana TaxID=191504 RepID=A0AAV5EKP5_ELECO|nr:hypothetical protein PR202_gb11498 [Eleusine coracana subsp. coracana]
MALVAVTAMTTTTTAQPQQQQQPALPNLPSAACPPPQATLLPCISYFMGNSSSPATACCSQVQAMFESQAPCLCAAMASAPSQLGSAFGAAQAMLPTACNLPPNACSSSGSGSSSSTTTATPASGTTADAPAPATSDVDPTAAGGGQKSVPGLIDSAAAASDYRGIPAASAVLLVSLFVACYVY